MEKVKKMFSLEEFGDEDMPMHLRFLQIVHLQKQYMLQMLKPTGLKMSQAGILVVLKKCGPLSQREIADQIHVTAPSVTAAIQKLEKLGYIERKTDEKDQRMQRIRLSQKGEELLKEMKIFLDRTEATLFEGISAEEKMLLRRLTMQMKENLESVRSEERERGCFAEYKKNRD